MAEEAGTGAAAGGDGGQHANAGKNGGKSSGGRAAIIAALKRKREQVDTDAGPAGQRATLLPGASSRPAPGHDTGSGGDGSGGAGAATGTGGVVRVSWPAARTAAWGVVPRMGQRVRGTRFVLSKTPLSASYGDVLSDWEEGYTFTVDMLFTRLRGWRLDVGLVVDATCDDVRYFNPDELDDYDVEYVRLPNAHGPAQGGGDTLPTREATRAFMDAVVSFARREPTRYVLVLDEYGVNRSSFLVAAFLALHERMQLGDAVKRIAAARPPGVYSKDARAALAVAFGVEEASLGEVPAKPDYDVRSVEQQAAWSGVAGPAPSDFAWLRSETPADLRAPMPPPMPVSVGTGAGAGSTSVSGGGQMPPPPAVVGAPAAAPPEFPKVPRTALTRPSSLGFGKAVPDAIDAWARATAAVLVPQPHGAPHFPGPLPAALTSAELSSGHVTADWFVTWSARGARVLMLSTIHGVFAIPVDPAEPVVVVALTLPSAATGRPQNFTLLDGVVVVDKPAAAGQQPVKRFLCSDVVAVEGKNFSRQPLGRRLNAFKTAVEVPWRKAAAQMARAELRIRLKDYQKVKHAGYVLHKLAPSLTHGSNGLVFVDTRATYGTPQSVLRYRGDGVAVNGEASASQDEVLAFAARCAKQAAAS